jgi:hypothetical protein
VTLVGAEVNLKPYNIELTEERRCRTSLTDCELNLEASETGRLLHVECLCSMQAVKHLLGIQINMPFTELQRGAYPDDASCGDRDEARV